MEGLPLQGQAEQEGDEHFMGCEWKLSFYTLQPGESVTPRPQSSTEVSLSCVGQWSS